MHVAAVLLAGHERAARRRTDYAPAAGAAWFFHTGFGAQGAGSKVIEYLAWALRPGDFARVPAPGTRALLGMVLGLLGLGYGRRRGRR